MGAPRTTSRAEAQESGPRQGRKRPPGCHGNPTGLHSNGQTCPFPPSHPPRRPLASLYLGFCKASASQRAAAFAPGTAGLVSPPPHVPAPTYLPRRPPCCSTPTAMLGGPFSRSVSGLWGLLRFFVPSAREGARPPRQEQQQQQEALVSVLRSVKGERNRRLSCPCLCFANIESFTGGGFRLPAL